MKKTRHKTLLAILSILVIPVVVYGFFELNSLTVDERELETIYQRQLESVLFSINQNVQDKVSEITTPLDKDIATATESQITTELGTFNFFKFLYLKGIEDSSEELYSNVEWKDELFKKTADSIYNANSDVVARLVRYKNTGDFLKIETGTESFFYKGIETDYFFFVLGAGEGAKFGIYFFDAILMIEQYLVPKFQEVASGDYILTCQRISDSYLVYSTSSVAVNNVKSEPIDLLPKYAIGIAREGGTVEEAVNKRKNQNLLALGLLMVVMILGIGLVFRNIQQEMALAQKKADFVSNVSHEIRTPLALINMFAETLLFDRVKEESKKKEYYEIITKEVARLTNMVNRILSFSKIEAEKRTYKRTPVDLNTVVADVFNTYSYHLKNNGFEHDLTLNPSELIINADPEALIEVLVNLIDNGMKYSQDHKQVMIETGIKNHMAFVSIADKGMGIAKNQLNKLFEKFYRVPTGDVHDTKGSGLGLTIVKHIMDSHEGTVEVVSEQGKGSTFKLFFPLYKNEHV